MKLEIAVMQSQACDTVRRSDAVSANPTSLIDKANSFTSQQVLAANGTLFSTAVCDRGGH